MTSVITTIQNIYCTNIVLFKMSSSIENWAKMQAAREPKGPAAQKKVWSDFLKQFPNANESKLVAEVFIDDKYDVSAAGLFFKEGPGSLLSVFRSNRKYWSQRVKPRSVWRTKL